MMYEVLRRKDLAKDKDYRVRPVGETRFRLNALKHCDVHFAALTLPFNLLEQETGLDLLDDPIDVIGPYQSTAGFVRRDWAVPNAIG
jgi:hypothetical protein